MGQKKIRPITPGMRGQVSGDFKEITKSKPEKSLLQSKNSSGGRNNKGRITSQTSWWWTQKKIQNNRF